ncbi:hypothetical protein AZE42_04633 [Rhizopogon vesiculosus]|uniref:Uncharacterized protein n=1 Tax=Rhizopogon vesiculosus TaxID=180088 RepID=A0A1J8QME6_9AGAM|nr:hypothetical protein AZE42_04633 [Rhizopogon vesiculosus]
MFLDGFLFAGSYVCSPRVLGIASSSLSRSRSTIKHQDKQGDANNCKKTRQLQSTGHSDVHGNEEADKQAKLAAESRQTNSPPTKLPRYLRYGALPLNISVLKEVHRKAMYVRWECL